MGASSLNDEYFSRGMEYGGYKKEGAQENVFLWAPNHRQYDYEPS